MTEQPPPAAPGSGPQRPSFGNWIGSLWLFTLLRFGIFFALWGLLYLAGLRGLFPVLLALLLSVPLSFVLLAKPRRRVAENLEARLAAREQTKEDLDRRLNSD